MAPRLSTSQKTQLGKPCYTASCLFKFPGSFPLTGKESDLSTRKIHDFCFFVYLVNRYDSLDFHEATSASSYFHILEAEGDWTAQGFELLSIKASRNVQPYLQTLCPALESIRDTVHSRKKEASMDGKKRNKEYERKNGKQLKLMG